MLLCCLILIVLLGFDVTIAITVLKLNNTCNGSNTNLGCYKVPRGFGYEITCPKQGLSEKIAVHYKRFSKSLLMDIKCDNIDVKNYCLLDDVRAEKHNIVKVHFENCPLGENTILMEVVEQLGLEHVTVLELNDFDMNGALRKQHLIGLSDLKGISLKAKYLSEIPQNLFEGMPVLESLVLRDSNITTFAAFSGLKNLISLDLSNNNIAKLPSAAFKDLNKLELLYLQNNSLNVLEKHMISDAISVIKLDLSYNLLEELNADVFSTLKNLSEIILNENNFRQLPKDLFKNNMKLKDFLLTNSKRALPSLPNGMLANLPLLRNVTLKTGLETIPSDLFLNSTGLQIITISNNYLTTLPLVLFMDQANLYHLDLRNNKFAFLPDDIFKNMKNLMVLQLTNNKLTQISSVLFKAMSKLEVLCIEDNNLKVIDDEAFRHVTSLRHMSLENNQINFDSMETSDVSPFQYLVKLQSLNLAINKINRIYRDWKFQLPRLENLDLSFNKIPSLFSADLIYLATNDLLVNLTHNNLNSFSFEDVDLLIIPSRGIKVILDLNHNPINCNCEILKFIQFINHKIGEQVAKHLRFIIDQLVCIQPPDLKGRLVKDVAPQELLCALDSEIEVPKKKVCPDSCLCFVRKYDGVLLINCNNRQLDELPELPEVQSLSLVGIELHIEQNNITILPRNDTPGYKDVTKILMSRNDLFKINAWNIPSRLTHLDVRYNHVCKIDENVLRRLNSSQMVSLKLSHNPWECYCDSVALLQFVHRNRHIEDFKEMRCHMSSFDGVALQDLTISDICPEDKGPLIALAIAISLIGFTIGLIAALYYKYQQEIKVWLYAHNMFLWLVTEEELDKGKKYDAFISYSHHDEGFVDDVLLTELESGPMPYKLCIHHRDWMVGEWVQDQIIRSVQDSRRTIVVLSENFIKSVWTRMEFRTAHQEALEEKRPRVIVIIYGEIGDIENLDPLLKVYLKMNTYLKWGEPNFWNKLRYAMPHAVKKIRGELKTKNKCTLFSNNDNPVQLNGVQNFELPHETNSQHMNPWKGL